MSSVSRETEGSERPAGYGVADHCVVMQSGAGPSVADRRGGRERGTDTRGSMWATQRVFVAHVADPVHRWPRRRTAVDIPELVRSTPSRPTALCGEYRVFHVKTCVVLRPPGSASPWRRGALLLAVRRGCRTHTPRAAFVVRRIEPKLRQRPGAVGRAAATPRRGGRSIGHGAHRDRSHAMEGTTARIHTCHPNQVVHNRTRSSRGTE